MALYDSSALIDYLDGDEAVAEYVADHADERTITVPLAAFEVYQGEVYRSGTTDLSGIDDALQWLEIVPVGRFEAREAAALLDELRTAGEPLAARDAFIAGAAAATDETLVATDSDFENEALRDRIRVDVL